jgi:hypothetical protein
MSIREDAENSVIYLAVGGALAGLVGYALAISQWPNDEAYQDHGNAVVAYLGVAVAVVGQLALFVALVAVGTRLGVHWAGLVDRDAAPAPAVASYLDEDGL